MNISRKTQNNRISDGFTLAELLVVVAIIAVLVAIAIPVFSAQTEKAREATDIANIRAAYGEVATEAIGDNETTLTKTVKLSQKTEKWQVSGHKETLLSLGDVSGDPKEDGDCVVSWQSDSKKILFDFTGSSSRYYMGDTREQTMRGMFNVLTDILKEGYELGENNNHFYTMMSPGTSNNYDPYGNLVPYKELMLGSDFSNTKVYWGVGHNYTWGEILERKGISYDQLKAVTGDSKSSVYFDVGESRLPVSVSFVPENNPNVVRYIYFDTGHVVDVPSSSMHVDGIDYRHFFAYHEDEIVKYNEEHK